MRAKILLILYISFVLGLSAQEKNTYTSKDTVRQDTIINRSQQEDNLTWEHFLPPSPQAAALARYGEYPVSLATGVPEINIPLYEIKMGSFTLPVSLSYHASGNKVNDVASSVGLGWVLNAGGVVTRLVLGVDDMKSHPWDATSPGYFHYSYENVNNRMQQIIACNSTVLDRILNIVEQGLAANYDTESDRYTYNFGGKFGVFRYSYIDDAFITLNHDPIKIEALRGPNSYFTITDTDGIIYTFAAQESTGVADDENQTAVSAWYLTKIETPNGTITMEYQQSTANNYGCSDMLRTGEFGDFSDPNNISYINDTKHYRSKIQYVYRTKLLKTIRWKNYLVSFDYANDRTDIGDKRLTAMTVKDNDGNIYKTVSFNNSIYLGNNINNKRMMLQSLSTSDEGTYTFQYNSQTLPDYPYGADGLQTPYCHTDYWGYYNGKTSTLFVSKTINNGTNDPRYQMILNNQGADRNPVEQYTKAGVLWKITYPTGGSTLFSYELNSLNDNSGNIGGLRVSSITNTDKWGNQLSKKEYQYASEQRVTESPDLYCAYHSYCFYEDGAGGTGVTSPYVIKECVDVVSEPYFPTFTNNSATVLYGFVSERLSNGEINDYFFDVFPATDNLGFNADASIHPQFFQASLRDKGLYNPLLLKKQIYASLNTNAPIREEIYEYQESETDTIATGCRLKSFAILFSSFGGVSHLQCYQCNTPFIRYEATTGIINRKLLKSKTTIDHQLSIVTTESYTYDDSLRTTQPKTITITNSDGQAVKTEYKYPFQYSDVICHGMATRNVSDAVIEEIHSYGNTITRVIENRYMKQNEWYYPEYQFLKLGPAQKFEKYHFQQYDANGNPLTVIENGTDKTALVWGFKSSWPVAKISGMSYEDIQGLGLTGTLNSIANDSVPERMGSYLATLRNGIGSNGLVTTYNYRPLYGVSAITAENGYTTYYDYGTDGKLSAIRDNDGPLQQFTYQYVNPFSGNSNTTNYVQTTDMLSSTTGKITRQYHDGLGRPVETVRNVTGNYVYTMQTYDQKGRVVQEWLPSPGGTSPSYVSDIATISSTFHGDNHAYSITSYDAIDRPIFIQTPGDAWHSASKGITKEYITNAANNVKCYQAALTTNNLIKNGSYAGNTLYAEKTTDEDGKSVTIYTDKIGRKVLERRGTGNDTYYIYDDLGQLRFVLSPQYQESGYKDVYGYEYRYDGKGRLVKKKLPQCEYTQYWYDTAGRMKFMQDANLRSNGLYRFMLYDKFGRLCIQGTCTDCWRGESVNTVTYNTSGTGFQGTGYSLGRASDISGTISLEVVNYYDSYDFIRLYNQAVSNSTSINTTGLQTGSIRKASDGSTLTDAIYYDYKGRPVQTRRISLDNRLTTTATSYKYWGDIYQIVQTDYPGTNTSVTPTLTTTTTNNYSSTTGLLSYTTLSIKRGTATAVQKTVRQNSYDNIGRIITNTRNGGSVMTSYTYNPRNWLTEINGTGFHEWLSYADGANPLYNGNISTQKWQVSNENFNRGYRFTYNALNWLMEAVYGEQNFQQNDNDYNEKMLDYSANGMMKRFQRRGLKDDGEYGKIDNLHIYLDGNRPTAITDDADPQTVYGAMEFNDGSSSGQEYFYDACGSLVADANKGIAHIEYDNLNYPKKIQFTNGNTIEYVYTPDGQKLRAKYQTAIDNIVVPLNTTTTLSNSQIVNTTQTDYIGSVIYTGTSSGASTTTSLNKYLFEGGYATFNNSIPVYHYYTQDHLGNNRAVVSDNGTVEQITHYYPFGGTFSDVGLNSSLQPYKYNGKELDRMHGLNWYEYGHRQYDPVLPMFTKVDLDCEDYPYISPYAYCLNSPILHVDIDGKSVWTKMAKAVIKVGKSVAKHGVSALNQADTYISAFSDVSDNINTLTDANATTTEKVMAGLSLASEALPVSLGDIKDVKKTYQTYTKTHPITKQKYVGRTSGTSDPFKNIEIRDKHHHKNKEGFGPARLDKSSDNPDAIRGQEQFMIDQVGGAQSHGGTSGNKINGISSNNPNRKRYEEERRKEFGEEP